MPGGLGFGPEDVAFLFLPEAFHEAARTFFAGHLAEPPGRRISVPNVDPTWDMPRIQAAYAPLAAVPAAYAAADAWGTCDYCGGPTADGLCLLCGNVSLS